MERVLSMINDPPVQAENSDLSQDVQNGDNSYTFSNIDLRDPRRPVYYEDLEPAKLQHGPLVSTVKSTCQEGSKTETSIAEVQLLEDNHEDELTKDLYIIKNVKPTVVHKLVTKFHTDSSFEVVLVITETIWDYMKAKAHKYWGTHINSVLEVLEMLKDLGLRPWLPSFDTNKRKIKERVHVKLHNAWKILRALSQFVNIIEDILPLMNPLFTHFREIKVPPPVAIGIEHDQGNKMVKKSYECQNMSSVKDDSTIEKYGDEFRLFALTFGRHEKDSQWGVTGNDCQEEELLLPAEYQIDTKVPPDIRHHCCAYGGHVEEYDADFDDEYWDIMYDGWFTDITEESAIVCPRLIGDQDPNDILPLVDHYAAEDDALFDELGSKCIIQDCKLKKAYSATRGHYMLQVPDGSISFKVVEEVRDKSCTSRSSVAMFACLSVLTFAQGVMTEALAVLNCTTMKMSTEIQAKTKAMQSYMIGKQQNKKWFWQKLVLAWLLAALFLNVETSGKNWKDGMTESTVNGIQSEKASKLFGKRSIGMFLNKPKLAEKDFLRDVLNVPDCLQLQPQEFEVFPATFLSRGNEDEFRRLSTFSKCPEANWLPAVPLAENGYYYKQNKSVACHFCEKQYPQWDKEWDPKQKHLPHCSFLSAVDCGNIPMKPASDNGKYQPAVLAAFGELELNQLQGLSQVTLRNAKRGVDTFKNAQLPEGEMEALRITYDQERQENDALIDDPQPSTSNTSSSAPMRQDRASGLQYFVHTYDERGRPVSTAQKVEFSATGEKRNASMKKEVDRLKTFDKVWKKSHIISTEELARCGFYFAGNGDRVRCAFCNGVLRNWTVGDNAVTEHRRHYPTCPFVLNLDVGNEPLARKLDPNLRNSTPATSQPSPPQDRTVTNAPRPQSTARNVPMSSATVAPQIAGTIQIPKHSNFSTVESRMLTYEDAWPTTNVQRPRELAVAGFFYTGASDNVRCFHCDGGLRNWLESDQPWIEHAKWFPRCGFLQRMKGADFVLEESRKHDQQGLSSGVLQYRSAQGNTAFSATSSGQGSGITERPTTGGAHRVEAREVRARFDTDRVRMILSMGYEEAVVKYVILQRLKSTGDDFPNTEELLEAVLAEGPTLEEKGVSHYETILQREFGKPMTIVYPKLPGEKPAPEPANSMTQSTAASLEIPGDEKSLVEENRQLKEQTTCKICMDKEVSMVFIPCGHLVACADCAPNLRLCPICRRTITGTIRTFLS